MIYLVSLNTRQVEPSPHNLAANALASNVQQRNLRRVDINTNIIFAIWILETASVLVMFVVWIIFQKKELTTTLIFLFWYVAIPLTFLMNNSDNKDLMANIGLLDIVRSTFGIPLKNISEPKENVSTVADESNETTNNKGRMSQSELEKWVDLLEMPSKRSVDEEANEVSPS